MEIRLSHIWIILASFIAGVIIGSSFRSCGSNPDAPDPIQIHDTISLTDTIIQERTHIICRTHADTFIVHTRDSIHDTIRIEIPIDHKIYTDRILTSSGNIDLGIKYSGYRASLDSVGVAYHADIKPAVVEKKSGFGQFVGIGLGVGYGGSMIDQRIYAAPYVGVHVTYGLGYTWRK